MHLLKSKWKDNNLITLQDTRIQDALGSPIKGFGEENRRRRRQHVAHSIYERNGKKYIRMQFYIQGIRNKATVHLEKDLVCIYCLTQCVNNTLYKLIICTPFNFNLH